MSDSKRVCLITTKCRRMLLLSITLCSRKFEVSLPKRSSWLTINSPIQASYCSLCIATSNCSNRFKVQSVSLPCSRHMKLWFLNSSRLVLIDSKIGPLWNMWAEKVDLSFIFCMMPTRSETIVLVVDWSAEHPLKVLIQLRCSRNSIILSAVDSWTNSSNSWRIDKVSCESLDGCKSKS